MDIFLEKYNLPKLNQEESKNLNSADNYLMKLKQCKTKQNQNNLPANKSPGK